MNNISAGFRSYVAPLFRRCLVANFLYSISYEDGKSSCIFFMYPTTVLLSVQYVSLTSLHSSSLRKTHPILEAKTAAVSSSLGMVTGFNGATRDLPITNEQ